MKNRILVGIYPKTEKDESEKRVAQTGEKFEEICGNPGSVRDWKVIRSKWGKPEFAYEKDRYLSISHSGDFWICAVGDTPVGIDLQIFEDCPYKEIAEIWFHSKEKEHLKKFGYENFFKIWTAKESYVKYTGCGIGPEHRRFYTADEKGLRRRVCGPGMGEEGPWLIRPVFQGNYSMCICTEVESPILFIEFCF